MRLLLLEFKQLSMLSHPQIILGCELSPKKCAADYHGGNHDKNNKNKAHKNIMVTQLVNLVS